jgi:hypothetical protein
MTIDAFQDMTFISEKKVAFRGTTRLLTVTPDEFFRLAGALQENETHIRAPMVFMDMSQSTEYEPLEQPKPPEPFYKRIDWTAVIVGVAVGAVVAIAVVTLFPGVIAAAGAALVAVPEIGVAAAGVGTLFGVSAETIAGIAFVDAIACAVASMASLATSDIQSGERHSIGEYIDEGIIGGLISVFTAGLLRGGGLVVKKGISTVWESGLLQSEAVQVRLGWFGEATNWTATRQKGTQQTYQVYQRTDINWNQTRTAGDKNFIGKTNAEAATKGLPPQLPDGNFATLHHIGQDSRGPLAEASTRYHGVGKYGQDTLHSQYGKNTPNPNYPIDRSKFGVDTREYWKWRAENR